MKIKVKKQKDILYTSEKPNVETDFIDEISHVSSKRKAESQLMKNNTDANYFTCIYFNNTNQLEEFLSKIGYSPKDKQYINGIDFATHLGLEIDTPSMPAPGGFRVNISLEKLIM